MMSKIEDILVLPSEMENIAQVEKLIDDLSAKYGLDAEIYGKLSVALIEAVNNAILHGNRLDADKKVTVKYVLDKSEIEFTISDCGEGFDFMNTPDPTLPENLEKTHGRGIFLMSHLADEIEFLDKGTVVRLKFMLS